MSNLSRAGEASARYILPSPSELRAYIATESGRRALVLVNLSSIHFLTIAYGFAYSQTVLHQVNREIQLHSSAQALTTRTFEGNIVFYVRDKDCTEHLCNTLACTLAGILAKEGLSWGIGITEFSNIETKDIEEIFQNTLIASETALERESRCCSFSQTMHGEATNEFFIVQELAKITHNQNHDAICLQYQPIVDLATNQINELEVLCRIKSEKLGIISPSQFIPLAEQTKYIIPLGFMIFQEAFKFLQTLRSHGFMRIRLSINVSVIQLLDTYFLKTLVALMHAHAISPSSISLEITESCIITNYQMINELFKEIQQLGMQLALDDFGTGYSSLAHERTLHLDSLKIDKIFVQDLLSIPEERTIIRDIISMGHRMGHAIIAEGVETERQYAYLHHHGCDKIQGYWVSEPLYGEAMLRFLGETSRYQVSGRVV
ncbi:EAL domain-containing protein [uncultured Sphaerochaeta sp.]|uniref:EAL domain-containing protein n=1 Tax=uncultured Sphaerochaeta sp. TaxID=886478 RepID=UPI002AA75611|nr:EAL domain-containing protein [uncultured Sphaerochaeta sp.]